MTVIPPLNPTNLFMQPDRSLVTAGEERQLALRPEQIVRATVVEGGLDQALLEMSHRQFRAQIDQPLQSGHQLTLQVLRTHPQLELRLISDPLAARLGQLLPQLTKRFDWSGVIQLLQRQPDGKLPDGMPDVLARLQQVLQPHGGLDKNLATELMHLVSRLQQQSQGLADDAGYSLAPNRFAQGYVANLSAARGGVVAQFVTRQLGALQRQLAAFPHVQGGTQQQQWSTETSSLLLPFRQGGLQNALSTAQSGTLVQLLSRFQQYPQLPRALAAEISHLLQRFPPASSGGPSLAASSAETLPAVSGQGTPASFSSSLQESPTANHAEPAPAQSTKAQRFVRSEQPLLPAPLLGPKAATASTSTLSAELQAGFAKLLGRMQILQAHKGGLPPELMGRLEGLLDKLQAAQAAQVAQPGSQGMEQVTAQLNQLVRQDPLPADGNRLGFLSQLFGLHLEAELLRGKKKESLASLKLGLLSLREELGKRVEEPLQRLELMQLAKARLGEEQVQFLPLPFDELEEGYLLMERRREQAGTDANATAPFQLSLSLRLSGLGSMRIDILYEQQGLHLRMSCEDQEKKAYLQEHAAELEEAIETVPVKGLSFSADARQPAHQLLERLFPEAASVLDARI